MHTPAACRRQVWQVSLLLISQDVTVQRIRNMHWPQQRRQRIYHQAHRQDQKRWHVSLLILWPHSILKQYKTTKLIVDDCHVMCWKSAKNLHNGACNIWTTPQIIIANHVSIYIHAKTDNKSVFHCTCWSCMIKWHKDTVQAETTPDHTRRIITRL